MTPVAPVEPKGPDDNNVRRLHQYYRTQHTDKPKYSEGIWNGAQWTVTVQIGGTDHGVGKGSTKKYAEDAAAAQALKFFKVEWVELREIRDRTNIPN